MVGVEGGGGKVRRGKVVGGGGGGGAEQKIVDTVGMYTGTCESEMWHTKLLFLLRLPRIFYQFCSFYLAPHSIIFHCNNKFGGAVVREGGFLFGDRGFDSRYELTKVMDFSPRALPVSSHMQGILRIYIHTVRKIISQLL